MKIKLLLHIVNSKRDRAGNCYYFFVATDPKTGVWTEATTSGGESNIYAVYRYMGLEAAEMQATYEELPVRQFDRRVKEMPHAGCTPEDIASWVTGEFAALKKKLKAQARKARARAKAEAHPYKCQGCGTLLATDEVDKCQTCQGANTDRCATCDMYRSAHGKGLAGQVFIGHEFVESEDATA